jgi:hypothetical protein
MTKDELKLGTIYVVAGEGDARLVDLCKGPLVKMDFHGCTHYIEPASILHPSTEEGLRNRWFEGWTRGIVCRRPGCWCEPYRDSKPTEVQP